MKKEKKRTSYSLTHWQTLKVTISAVFKPRQIMSSVDFLHCKKSTRIPLLTFRVLLLLAIYAVTSLNAEYSKSIIVYLSAFLVMLGIMTVGIELILFEIRVKASSLLANKALKYDLQNDTLRRIMIPYSIWVYFELLVLSLIQLALSVEISNMFNPTVFILLSIIDGLYFFLEARYALKLATKKAAIFSALFIVIVKILPCALIMLLNLVLRLLS